jgi:hypothetical protein
VEEILGIKNIFRTEFIGNVKNSGYQKYMHVPTLGLNLYPILETTIITQPQKSLKNLLDCKLDSKKQKHFPISPWRSSLKN